MTHPRDGADFFQTRYIREHLKLLPANSLSFDELFTHYNDAGFLYQEKRKNLLPHLDLIRHNWNLGWAAGRDIMWTLIYQEERLNKMGTVTTWKTTANSWQSQHLTSQQYAAGVLHLLLAAQDEGIHINTGSAQNWYSPTNNFAMKVYGRMERILGADCADSCLLNYLQVDPFTLKHTSGRYKIHRCTDKDHTMIQLLAEQYRGRVYCAAEDLNTCDVEMSGLNQEYQKFGLSRKRYIWVAVEKDGGNPKGMIIAYRGPFGFNFSFLENRCDLMVAPSISQDHRRHVCRLLVHSAAFAYFDDTSFPEYPIHHMVVLTDALCSEVLTELGAVRTRQYYQGIWMNPGFEKWKDYMRRVFSIVLKRENAKKAVSR